MKKIIALMLGLMMLLSLTAATAEEADLHVADGLTLRFWYPLNFTDIPGMTDYNDSDAYAWLEEKTGVHIDWIHPAKGTEKESFTLLFASDNPPDLIYNDGRYFYNAGPDAAIEDGLYVNLADYEDLMPNYMAIINSSEELKRQTVTDDGNRWCFNYLLQEKKAPDFGIVIRQDFLDKVGMERPVTYDDWHAVLTAFKEQLGIESPLFVANDTFTWYSEFAAGYGITKDWSLDAEGKVIYGPAQDGFGEYIEMMKQWYAEGLIDQSFSIRTSGTPEDDLVLNDKIGAWCDYNSRVGDTYYPRRGATNPDFNLLGTRIPVKEGGEAHYRAPDSIVNGMQIAISASSKHIEEAIRWMDAQYSEAAAFVMNYGVIEGEDGSYYIDENGQPHWGTLITNNPDGLTTSQARRRYVTTSAPYEDHHRTESARPDSQAEAVALLQETDTSAFIPACITMSAEEQEEFSDIMSDIITYQEEFTVKYIMGNATQTFEEFRAQLKTMGIERATELKQAAVDRYNAR